MPGYVRDRFPDLSAEDRDDYTCSICHEIFNIPVTTTCCRQTFCENCITEWLQTNTTCPYDRKPLTPGQLSPPPRAMANTLGRFVIRCDYWDNGCRDVIKLDGLPQHTGNCRYKYAKCAKCDGMNTPGHDCIEVLRAEIQTLRGSDTQLLDECRRHLSAPVVLDKSMSADMTDKTLAILRQQLRDQNSVYLVCKYVCEGLDLEYDSEWHCTADWRGGYVGHYKQGQVIYLKVEFTPITFIVFRTPKLNWSVLKARLKYKKVHKNLTIIKSYMMNSSMVSVVTDIVFEAIDRSDIVMDAAIDIGNKLNARYPGHKWQCFLYSKGCCNYSITNHVYYIYSYVDELVVTLFAI